MSDANFTVTFDGESLRNGEMDVHRLAPALLSLGDLFNAASATLNGPDARASVRVRADFRAGSFSIEVHLVQSIVERAKAALLGHEEADARQLVRVVLFWIGVPGAVTGGLYKAFKWLHGKSPARIVYENHITQIFNNEGDVYTAPEAVGRLLDSRRVISALKRTVEPLQSDGIEKVEFRGQEPGEVEAISRSEEPWTADMTLTGEEPGDEQQTSDQICLLTVVKPSFDEAQKWRFSMGGSGFNASMDDTDFLARIRHRDDGFYDGDILRVKLRTSQRVVNGRLRVSHSVLNVLEHRHAGEQRHLTLPPMPPAAQ